MAVEAIAWIVRLLNGEIVGKRKQQRAKRAQRWLAEIALRPVGEELRVEREFGPVAWPVADDRRNEETVAALKLPERATILIGARYTRCKPADGRHRSRNIPLRAIVIIGADLLLHDGPRQGKRLLRDDIDDAAGLSSPEEHGRRPLQNFDALYVRGVERAGSGVAEGYGVAKEKRAAESAYEKHIALGVIIVRLNAADIFNRVL